jgi:hypothetical protein
MEKLNSLETNLGAMISRGKRAIAERGEVEFRLSVATGSVQDLKIKQRVAKSKYKASFLEIVKVD